MADELFRARVEPRRAHGSPPAARPHDRLHQPEQGDDRADEVLDDLMASFDRRAGADGSSQLRANPANVLTSGRNSADAVMPGYSEPSEPADGTGPATLRSRRSAAPRRRVRGPWLIGGVTLAATAGMVTAVVSTSLSGADTAAAKKTPATSAPSVPAASARSSAALMAAAGPGAVASSEAADWIAAHIGPGHVVACDAAVCGLLRDRGFPDDSVVTVQSEVVDVEHAEVVVVGDVLRHQLGTGLAAVTAAEPLAEFTADASRVAVVPVALAGPGAYAARLAADRATRKDAGVALLHNARIVVTGDAEAALAAGAVDSRVCALLATLGGSHRIVVASFFGDGPGAGADYPLPGVVISEIDGFPAAGTSVQAAALRAAVQAQRPPYAPLSAARSGTGADQGLAIVFAQPGPLGLLTGTPS